MSSPSIPLAAILMPPGGVSALPRVMDYWLKVTGLSGCYVPLEVEINDLDAVLATLPKIGFVGLHVAPAYQKAMLAHADIITDRAALMGGANTIIFRKDGKLHGDNTDGYGFVENIRQSMPGWDPRMGPAAIYGAGQSARVIIAALLEVGVQEIRVASRTRPKTDQLRQEFGTRIKVYDWIKAGNLADGAAMVVNATPLGREGMPEFRVPLDGLRPGSAACDLAIDPPDTRFLRQAHDYGSQLIDGAGMMLCQAAPSFERWFGARPPTDDAARALLRST